MTWDLPPTTGGKFRRYYPPSGQVVRTGGPERTQDTGKEEQVERRYVGFVRPADDDEQDTELSQTIPGVW